MGMVVGDRASFPHAVGLAAERTTAQEGLSPARLFKAVCTPGNLLVCAVVAFGWFALLGWTGAGPDGWQARLCADLDLQPRSCAAVQLLGEPGRTAARDTVGTTS
ncbi:hypothetical protein ASF53_19900 [Methylobacterium sp. Leaf123]|uniref:hypothetical protein n=1 Tax=Methylobacterium sp. Leaf123 TaxID=1736264 RepID=UPI0006F2154C|nr:hypothetical protein [Methylobacterium sp. Leaf123]KQQ27163.1 hypothetical protein ASF53_19900 [Methylobacterium sp. Leaf123]